MAENRGLASGTSRHHLVLVPGFVGFDALGQLDYYAGVTQVFDSWNDPANQDPRRVSIHYFDNFPTASVELRATRLRGYIAERIARGEFAPGDTLALIGHSTGGLDIRKALFDMAADEAAVLTVDGCCPVRHDEILAMTKRIAFLSVPQYGTNIADFAYRFSNMIQGLSADAVVGLQLNHGALGQVRRQLFAPLESSPSNFVLALVDTLDESDESSAGTAAQRARQREARFQLTSWLDNIANDFSIIEDLRSETPANTADDPKVPPHPKSPAHFSAAERHGELDTWKKYGIKTHTYASRIPPRDVAASGVARGLVTGLHWASPFLDFAAKVTPRGPAKWLLPPVALGLEAARAGEIVGLPLLLSLLGQHPSLIFDIFHAACADARGPFRDPDTIAPGSLAPTFRRLGSTAAVARTEIAVGDSDGVVNTLSMFWPYDSADPTAHGVDLVDADHGDVIGHFELKALARPEPGGRRFYAYDFFQTELKFTQAQFDRLWSSVFDFCVSGD